MSLFNKKKMETLVWVDEPYMGFQVDFIIKKEILSDSRSHGIIYIDGNEYSYWRNNLADIVPASDLTIKAQLVQKAIKRDETIVWNIVGE